MKHLLLTTIAAVLIMGCGESKPPESPTAKAPDIPLLIDLEVDASSITIMEAAGRGDIQAVKQQLAVGADANAKSDALIHAATFGQKEVAELLIDSGADVNVKDAIGQTPLHGAAVWGHKEVAEQLISKGADVNAKLKGGETPLDLTSLHPETADLLRKHGAKTAKELKAEGK